jgi:hypothetical protein
MSALLGNAVGGPLRPVFNWFVFQGIGRNSRRSAPWLHYHAARGNETAHRLGSNESQHFMQCIVGIPYIILNLRTIELEND